MKKHLILFSFFTLFFIPIFAQDINTELFDAIKYNSYDDVVNLVKKGANVNITDKDGATPLMWAVFKSDIKMVEFLVSRGADVKKKGIIYLNELKTGYYGSLLCIASAEGKLDMVRYLHEECKIPIDDREINSEKSTDSGWTPLQWACYQKEPYGVSDFVTFDASKGAFDENNKKVVSYLISQKANVNFNDYTDKNTPLILSLLSEKYAIADTLLTHDADFTLKNKDGNTALHIVANHSKWDIILSIIKKGGNMNVQDNSGYTPLMYCLSDQNPDENQIATLRMLYTAGADFYIKNKFGSDIYTLADSTKNEDIIKYIRNPSFDYALLLVMEKQEEVYNYVKSKDYIPNQKYVLNYSLMDIAAMRDLPDLIELLIAKGENVNSAGYNGISPLMNASMNNRTNALKLLINKGADINYQIKNQDNDDYDGKTALHFAVMNDNKNCAYELLKNNANPNIKDQYGYTPLHYAAKYNLLYNSKILINSDADINTTTTKGWTPLMLAADNNSENVAKLLIYKKANINTKNNEGKTVLDMVTERQNVNLSKFIIDPKFTLCDYVNLEFEDEIKELINNKVNVNTPDEENKFTALHYAARNGKTNIVRLLCNSGADVNTKITSTDLYGWTPLMLAAYNNQLDNVKILFFEKADVNLKNKKGQTALDLAISNKATETVEFLKNPKISSFDLIKLRLYNELLHLIDIKKVDVNEKNKAGQTLLHYAAFNGDKYLVESLINRKALVNATDTSTWTPLHYAAREGETTIVNVLIENGADINSKNGSPHLLGWTPLMLAAYNNHLSTVKLLVYNKSDINIKNNDGKTALDIATKNNAKETQEFLTKPDISPFDMLSIDRLEELLLQIRQNKIDIGKDDGNGYSLTDYILFNIKKQINYYDEYNDSVKVNYYKSMLNDFLKKEVVYTVTINDNNSQAYNKGLRGTYIVLRYVDFEIGQNIDLSSHFRNLLNMPKTLVLYQNGKMESYTFESGKMGLLIKTTGLPSAERQKLIDDYQDWKQKKK